MQSGWHSRGYLPHFDSPELVQFLTFRLADALPQGIIRKWRADIRCQTETQLQNSIQNYLDKGFGACHLANPDVAAILQNALLHFDGQRYQILAWCIMPNHVHVLIEVNPNFSANEVLHSWKSYSAQRINRLLGLQGQFWQIESYDRFIRNENHFHRTLHYIEQNPVKAGLCARAENWPFGSAGFQPA